MGTGFAAFEAKIAQGKRERSKTFFGEFTFEKHMLNLCLLIVLLFCLALYHILLRQEVRSSARVWLWSVGRKISLGFGTGTIRRRNACKRCLEAGDYPC